MARRSDHSRQELTDLAIDKAIEIIDENGLSGFSARRVAAGIGYTVGTLYHVFGSYDLLLFHVNGRTLDLWHAELAAGLQRTRGDRLKYLAQAYLGFARRHYHRWTALFEFHAAADTPMPDWYREKIDRLFALIEEALPPRQQDPGQARQSAQVLWASIHGICVLSLSGKLSNVAAGEAETLINALLKTYLRGLR